MADGCFELRQRVFRQFDDRRRVATVKQSRNRLGYLKNATGIVVRGMVVDKAVALAGGVELVVWVPSTLTILSRFVLFETRDHHKLALRQAKECYTL